MCISARRIFLFSFLDTTRGYSPIPTNCPVSTPPQPGHQANKPVLAEPAVSTTRVKSEGQHHWEPKTEEDK